MACPVVAQRLYGGLPRGSPSDFTGPAPWRRSRFTVACPVAPPVLYGDPVTIKHPPTFVPPGKFARQLLVVIALAEMGTGAQFVNVSVTAGTALNV